MEKKSLNLDDIKKNLTRYCNFQERCYSEVDKKLSSYELTESQIKEITDYLINNSLLNEKRFTELFIQGKLRYRQWGRKKLVQELRLKGVEEELIQSEIRAVDDVDFENALYHLLNKKIQMVSGKNPAKKRQKIYRYLLSKGHEKELIYKALEKHMPIEN